MRNLNRLKVLFCVALVSQALACTRKVDAEKNVMTFSIPQNFQLHSNSTAAQGLGTQVATTSVNFMPQHIRVNVNAGESGGAIVAFWAWDACGGHCDDPANYAPPPATISLDVPSGRGRLIQFMAAGQVSGSDSMVFTYADKIVDLTGTQVSVSLFPTQIGTGTGSEGQISGRYILDGADAGNGPTGQVNIYMQPYLWRPRMLIHRDMMFGGFFNLFYVEGANMSYYMPELGLPLFNGVNITNTYLDTLVAGNNAMKVRSAAYYNVQGGGSELRLHEANDSYLGFFGPGASPATYHMCYPASNPVTSASTTYTGTGPYTLGSAIQWATTGSATNDIHRMSGGDGGICSGGLVEGVDKITLDSTRFAWGIHDILAFRGPFKNSGPSVVQTSFSGSTATLTWDYISDTSLDDGPGAIDGITIFYTTDGSGVDVDAYHLSGIDGLNCNAIALFSGWEKLYAAYPSETVTLTNITNPSDLRYVLCPTVDLGSNSYKYYDYGITPQSGAGNGGPSLRMEIAATDTVLDYGVDCQQVDFKIVNDSTGAPTAPGSAKTVDVNFMNGGPATLYSDSCTTSVSLPYTLSYASNEHTKTLWIKAASSGLAQVSAVPTDFMSTDKEFGFPGSRTGMDHFNINLINTNSGLAVNTCYKARVISVNASGYPVYGGGGTGTCGSFNCGTDSSLLEYVDGSSVTVSGGEINYYNSSDCSGTASPNSMSITIPDTTYYKDVSFKVSTASLTASSRKLKIHDSDAPSSGISYSNPFAVGDNSISQYSAMSMGAPTTGSCLQVYFMAQNNAGAMMNHSSDGNLTIRVTNTDTTDFKLFSSQADCAGNANPLQSMVIHTYGSWMGTEMVWVKNNSGTSVSRYMDYSNGSTVKTSFYSGSAPQSYITFP